jgi:hypothetical protein
VYVNSPVIVEAWVPTSSIPVTETGSAAYSIQAHIDGQTLTLFRCAFTPAELTYDGWTLYTNTCRPQILVINAQVTVTDSAEDYFLPVPLNVVGNCTLAYSGGPAFSGWLPDQETAAWVRTSHDARTTFALASPEMYDVMTFMCTVSPATDVALEAVGIYGADDLYSQQIDSEGDVAMFGTVQAHNPEIRTLSVDLFPGVLPWPGDPPIPNPVPPSPVTAAVFTGFIDANYQNPLDQFDPLSFDRTSLGLRFPTSVAREAGPYSGTATLSFPEYAGPAQTVAAKVEFTVTMYPAGIELMLSRDLQAKVNFYQELQDNEWNIDDTTLDNVIISDPGPGKSYPMHPDTGDGLFPNYSVACLQGAYDQNNPVAFRWFATDSPSLSWSPANKSAQADAANVRTEFRMEVDHSTVGITPWTYWHWLLQGYCYPGTDMEPFADTVGSGYITVPTEWNDGKWQQ